ncbi:MAG TPA: energy transducer TonB [Longimicrobium sp.]|nr:energy transducer TonB [Longimicrobium sp.]
MKLRVTGRAALLTAALLAFPAAAAAQGPTLGQGCSIVADSAIVPTPQQIAERQQLRLALDSIARAHGTPEPAGILYVDVDSMRQGKVFFIESNLSPEAAQAATARVGEYLTTLQSGRAYQALVRVGADYVAPAPGKRSCAPKLQSLQLMVDLMGRMMQNHPNRNRGTDPVKRNAVVRLVVSRDGTVPYAELMQPTGDAYVDPLLPAIMERMRFSPATLDDVPHDVRFRFTLPVNIIP